MINPKVCRILRWGGGGRQWCCVFAYHSEGSVHGKSWHRARAVRHDAFLANLNRILRGRKRSNSALESRVEMQYEMGPGVVIPA